MKEDRVFQALADGTRRQILDLLCAEDLPVAAMARRFDMTQPAVSQHLRVLREAKLVTARKQGRRRIYSANPRALAPVRDWLEHYEEFWGSRLARLGKHLRSERK
jgi:DNA-binding transcriptional ArsR family regulator